MLPLPHTLTGNKNSKQLIVFLHGWPDTLELWGQFIPQFEKDYLILNVSYPNFDDREFSKWGADFPEIVSRLKATIEEVNQPKRKITFVAHDWGCIYAYLFDQNYPGVISDLIVFDVAPWVRANALIIAYQLFLAKAFLIGGPIGNGLVRAFVKIIGYKPPYAGKINASWCYPYYFFWKMIAKAKFNPRNLPLYSYRPSCSVAYVWGKNKPMQFQNQKWIDFVKAGKENFIQEIEASHWIMNDQPQFVIELIKNRLKALAPLQGK